MRTNESQTSLLVLIIISAVEIVLASESTSCNRAVLTLYGWCEQWACADNCTCMERKDCRQYCDGQTCRDMRCLSPSICKQKVHLNGRIRPHVLNMFARAPFVTQDCSGGTCDIMRAKGPKTNKGSRKQKRRAGRRKDGRRRSRAIVGESKNEVASNAVLQNCVGGVCQRLISTLKISKQFCSHCEKVHCFGAHAKNCTQICAAGHCKLVQCDSEDCQQACLQNSNCTLKCGKDVKTCLQVCEQGSTCRMLCDAEQCTQSCGENKNCQIVNRKPSTRKPSTEGFSTNKSAPRTTHNLYTADIYNTSVQPLTTIPTKITTLSTTIKTTTAAATSTSFRNLLKSTLGNVIKDIETHVKTNSSNGTEDVKLVVIPSEFVTKDNNAAGRSRFLDLRMFGLLIVLALSLLH